jgi:hypothetical protein
MEKKTRGRPKQELNDDVKRNLQQRQHNYYVNYKNKKNQPPPMVQESTSTTTLQESLNNIVKIIDNIKAAFIK